MNGLHLVFSMVISAALNERMFLVDKAKSESQRLYYRGFEKNKKYSKKQRRGK